MIKRLVATHHQIKRSPLAHRFLGGAVWSVLGAVVSSGFTLVTMILIARLLGKQAYGQFVVIQSTLGMAGVVAGVGFGMTATRYVADLRVRDSVRLAHILALMDRVIFTFGFIASVLLITLSKCIATSALNSAYLALPLSIAAFSMFFTALDSYNKSILIGLESMRILAIVTIIGTTLGLPIMIIAAKSYGLIGLAVALVINSLLQLSISKYQVEKSLKYFAITKRPQGCWKEWPVLRDFALPSLLSGVFVPPAHWWCQAMLANKLNGYAEIALLGVAMQWFNVVMFLPNTAGRALLPILTEHFASGDNRQAVKLLKLAIISNLVVVIPVAVIISIASPWIMSTYGPQFQDGSIDLALIVCIAILVVGAAPVGQILAAGERMWLGAAMNLCWAIVYLGSALVLSKFGALGIVCSLGIAYVVHSVWVVLYAISHVTELKSGINNCAVTGTEI